MTKFYIYIAIAVFILVSIIVLMLTGHDPRQSFLSLFQDDDDEDEDDETRQPTGEDEEYPKPLPDPVIEMATLVRKSDDRLRVIESTGQVQLIDEKYELVFLTRKGQKIKINCSREAYEQVPFNQQGSLTYKMNTLVKFKFYEDTIYN